MRRAIIVAITVLLASIPLAAQEPGLARGFIADKVFDFQSGLDTVNTFQGNLILHLPIGPQFPVGGDLAYGLKLAYNSKVWDYESYAGYPRAIANRRSNAGLGWLLSLGRLVPPSHGTNATGDWIYESADGADHTFWQTLHHGVSPTPASGNVTRVAYTRDGSYLRLLVRDINNDGNADAIEVESPDGIVRSFDPGTGDLYTIKDRFANFVSISYPASLAGTPCPASDNFAWVITDSESARTNTVCFKEQPYFDSTYDGQVERVILAAPPDPVTGAARTTTFVFNYLLRDIARGCHSAYPGDSDPVEDVPMLFSVTQNPNTTDAITWNFSYKENHSNGACESGALAFYALPTGASVDYVYRNWWIPVERCVGPYPWIKNYPGIGTRTVRGPRIPDATWTYSSLQSSSTAKTICADDEVPIPQPIPSEEVVTTVMDPLGNVTEHYYSTWPMSSEPMWDENGNPIPDITNSPRGFRKNEYGLPFTRMPGTASGDKLLSQRVYTAAGYAANPKQPLRSMYVTYERDNNICTLLDDFCLHANERITSERVVYHDDGNRIADTDYSLYDGLGNMRQVTTGGTFASGNVRTAYTAFNERDPEVNPAPASGSDGVIDSGTYPSTFVMPTLNHSWILNTASAVRVTEGTTAITQACYDPTTGFLKAQRVLKGASRGSSDLLLTLGKDSAGNLTSEAYAGGDVSTNAPTTGSLCATADAPPTADYTINHTYDTGIRITSQYSGASFLSLDQTIHAASGVALSASDTAGNITTYGYDLASRLKKIAPTYTYTMASGSGAAAIPARVEEKTISAEGLGTVESHYQYDALGRLWRRKIRMPDQTWSVTETRSNGLGWPQSVSKPQKLVTPAVTPENPNPTEYDFVPTFKTLYAGYDPFGRAATVTAPDGHATSLTYAGVSSVKRTVMIGGAAGEIAVSTKEVYDRQQRPFTVTEAEGTTGAVTTTYGYDVGGRLRSVSMPGEGGTQTRTFKYDNRGFLEYEEHPELGVDGYGRTTYGPYDARGHSRRRITGTTNGAFDVTFAFDSAERVTSTTETGTGRALTLFAYDDPTGATFPQCSDDRCNGKLAAAARYNYLDDLGTIVATESYQYDGPGGRITRRDHAVGSSTVGGTTVFEGQNFFLSQSYNDFGSISSITYPCRKNANGLCVTTPRTVENGYTNGPLTSVAGFATSITYQPNGLPATVAHANTVFDTLTPSQYGMMRPCSMLTYRGSLQANSSDPCGVTASESAALSWTTGEYTYDGVGNVTRIGDTAYVYDPFSRLQAWTQTLASGAYNSTTLAMDTFGNHRYSIVRGCGPPINGKPFCYSTSVAPVEVVGTTNHYAGTTYDQAGNVTADLAQRQYSYDPFNRMKTAGVSGRQFRYLYGPDEERIAIVERVAAGGTTRNRTTWTLRGFGHELLSSWTDDSTSGTRVWNWVEDEIWRGGHLLASVTPVRTIHYSLDHLGSPRVLTDAAGQLLGYQTFAPFGTGGTSDGGFLQFTGQERDGAVVGGSADLPDYFHARQYDKWGRFLSVDPVLDIKKAVKEPQRWNRYAYAVNNPLLYTDPDGREHVHEPGLTKPLSEADWSDAPPVVKAVFYVQIGLLAAGAAEAVGAVEAVQVVGLAVATRFPRLTLAALEWAIVETAGITIGRKVVIGSYRAAPSYIETGRSLGATVFSYPSKLYNMLSPASRSAANMKFLDRAVARGADIYLSTDPGKIKAGTALDREVEYLLAKGFKIVRDVELDLWKFVRK
jgi:RHS repeat-associated protein